MPWAPDEALWAETLQLLSRVQSESRQPNWSEPKPNCGISAWAMSRGSPSARLTERVTAGPSSTDSAAFLTGSALVRSYAREIVGARSTGVLASAVSEEPVTVEPMSSATEETL